MIPVKIIKAIYIRKGPGVSFGFLGVIQPSGNEINMAGTVTGESHKGINTWYYLVNANGVKQYYWGGGISETTAPTEEAPAAPLPTALPTAAPAIIVPQWMNDLQLPQIWQRATGKGVGVAVVDTGIAAGIDDLPYKTSPSYTYAPGVPLTDGDNHGTNCAGLIGAKNSTGTYIGVAPGCDLYVCKISDRRFFPTPATDTMRYAAAISWCADQPEIHIISVSWASTVTDPAILKAIQDAVDKAIAANKIVVSATGDANSFGVNKIMYPCYAIGAIAIGAIPVAGQLYPYTNDHMLAVTTGYAMESYLADKTTAAMKGTSQANAVVAGIVALMIEKANFNYTPASIRQSLSAALKQASFTVGTTTVSMPVIDGLMLLNHFK